VSEPAAAAAPTVGKRRSRRGFWRRLTLRVLSVLVLLVLVVRFAGVALLPTILDSVGKQIGLSISYARLDLSLVSGSFELARLDVARRPADGASATGDDRLVHLDRLALDWNPWELLSGRLHVNSLLVSGIEAKLARAADGSFGLDGWPPPKGAEVPEAPKVAEAPVAPAAPTSTAALAPPAVDLDAPFDLSLPLRVDVVRVDDVAVHLRDFGVAPPWSTVLRCELSVSHLGATDDATRIQLFARAPELVDSVALIAQVQASAPLATAELALDVTGVHTGPLCRFASGAGIHPVARQISFGLVTKLKLEATDSSRRALAGALEIPRCEIVADLERQAAVTTSVTIRSLSRRGLELDGVDLSVEAAAARLADGALRVCGLEFRSTPQSTTKPDVREATPSATPAHPAPPAAPAAPFTLSVAQVRPHLSLRFHDEAVAPAADLEVALHDSTIRNFTLDPARAHEPIEIELALDAADAHVTLHGKGAPLAAKQSVELALAIALPHGIVRLAPYLALAGVASTLEDAKLSLEGNADFEAAPGGAFALDAALSRFALTDRGGSDVLLALERFAATGVVFDPAGPIRVGDVRLEKLTTRAFTDDAHALRFLGLRTLAPVLAPSAQPVDLELSNLGLELKGFELGAKADAPEPPPATFALTTSVRDVCDELALRGTVKSRPGSLDLVAEATLAAKGLRTKKIDPLLEGSGIRGELAAGALSLGLAATLKQEGATLHAQADLTELRFGDGDRTLVSLGALHVSETTIGADGVRVGRVAIERPVLGARRDADGALHAGGIVVLSQRAAAPEVAPAVEPPVAPPAGTPAPADPPPPATPPAAAPPAAARATLFELGELTLAGAQVDWSDSAVAPAVETQLTVDAKLGGLVLGRPAEPATFAVDVGLRDVLDRLHLGGSISTDPDRLGATLDVAIDGVRAGPLSAYLPAGLTLMTKAGRLRLHAEAASTPREGGGRSGRFEVKDFDWRDGEEGEPFFALQRFACIAPQLDLPAGDVVIDELTTSGVRARARRTSPESIEAFGFTKTSPSPTAIVAAPPPADTAAAQPEETVVPPPAAATPTPAAPLRRRRALPASLTLNKLEIGIDELRFEGGPLEGVTPPPLVGSLHVVNPKPLILLSKEEEKVPPIELRVEGAAVPVVKSLTIALTASPFADPPELDVDLALAGVDGTVVPKFSPVLASKIDASAIVAGNFGAHVHGELNAKRRGPTDFDLRNGFGVEFELRDLAWRAAPDAPVLIGLESVAVDVRMIRPTTGDVYVRSIEVHKITAAARRTADGIETGGIVFKTPPPAAAPAAPPESAPAAAPTEPAPATAPPPAAIASRAGEVRVDEFVMSGLAFRFVDETVTPPLDLPITDLDLVVDHFTTRAFTQPKPIEFRLALGAGTIDFKHRDERSLLGGLVGGVVGVVTPGEKKVDVEKRPAWDEIAMNGQLLLYPKPKGWVRLSVAGLELLTFKGPAAKSGVEISDGMLDTEVELRLRDDGLTVDSDTTLSWLSITEPPNGPISTYLKLPAPLDTVVYLLRDKNAQQRLPIHFTVEGEHVSTSEVTQVATKALLRLITVAIRSAPMRVLSGTLDAAQLSSLPGVSTLTGLTDLDNLGKLFTKSEEAPAYTGEPITIDLGPGVATLPPDARARLEPLFQQMRADDSIVLIVDHLLGSDDVAQLRRSSAPTPEECTELATRLRMRRAELFTERDAAAAEARTRFVIGRPEEAAPLLEKVRALDRECADVEESLDRALDLSGRPNGHAADKRVRSASFALADLRIADLREILAGASVKRMAERFEVKRVRAGVRSDATGGCIVVTPHKRK
jgi:hypothetical protein